MPLPGRLLLLVSLVALPGAVAAQDTFDHVDRIVAVGDVHGDFESFARILRQAGVIDERGRWKGGRTHFVQTGDILDRGPDSRKVMELLIALAPQAQKAGGRVHALTGNHEAMNVLGDLRYVVPGEYAAFAERRSGALRDRAYAVLSDSMRRTDPAYRQEWLDAHPLGWVEHRLAFEGNGRYGTWIRGNNAVIRIGDYLFLHGGISHKYVNTPLRDLNVAVQKALAPDAAGGMDNIAEDSLGPLWYRGLATGEESLMTAHVDSVLARFGVKHVVIGHTVTAGTVIPRHDGKVIMIDVGLSSAYGGPPAALIIEKGVPHTLHRTAVVPLPLGGDPLPYLRTIAALDPQPSRLQPLIEQLASAAGSRP